MTELLTAAQMRAIEQAAIDSGEVTGLELMERAGRGVVEAILDWRPELATAPHRAVVLCGPGNNGGDGFVVARLLKQRGWEVEVFLYGDEAKLPPDAAENARRWREIAAMHPYDTETVKTSGYRISETDLIIDALFGTGLTRPLKPLQDFLELNNAYAAPDVLGMARTVAIDVPSGLCGDSGRALVADEGAALLGATMQGDLTVTFHRRKLGHILQDGPWICGELRIVDLGLSAECEANSSAVRLVRVDAETFRKSSYAHKYIYGHALVLAGSVGRGGAARLAARGALRVGAGAVTVAAPPAALIENAARLDAIMLRPVRDLSEFLEQPDARKMNAICLGPGLGVGEATRAAVAAACGSGRRVVLDADALTSFEEEPEALFVLLHDGCVLTPHAGEFTRVFPDLAERLAAPAERGPAYSKVDATREAAARAGCTVLLKGADTVIADPKGRCSINSAHYERAAPWLATAGAGDVLAGFIAGLLARGFDPYAAASTAAWLHVECARRFGPGLIAEDLPEQLPGVFRELAP